MSSRVRRLPVSYLHDLAGFRILQHHHAQIRQVSCSRGIADTHRYQVVAARRLALMRRRSG